MEAELLRIEQKRSRAIREIDQNDALDSETKQLAARYMNDRAAFERERFKQSMLDQQRAYAMKAGQISQVGYGSTFAQQVAGISRSLDETKKQTSLQEEIARALVSLNTAIRDRSFAVYAN